MKKLGMICVALFLIDAGASRSAHSHLQGGSVDQRKYGAVTLIRVINTAEMEYRASKKHFADYVELRDSGALDTAGKRFGNAWSALPFDRKAVSEPLPGYEMHFTVDGTGKSYSVSLGDKSNYDSFFTDERGLIYEAKPIQ